MLVRLKEARLEAGLTQEEVAKSIRVTQAFVSKCESGERRMDPVELADFAELYGKPMSFFFTTNDNPSRGRNAQGSRTTD